MDTKPESDNPKNKNVTIFVTDDLRNRMDVLRNTHFSAMNMNQFTRYLVEVGLEEEETRFKEKKAQNKARLERAAIPVFSPESAEQKPRKKPSESKVIDMSKYAHNDMPPMDSVKFVGWEMTFLPYVGKTAAGEPIDINVFTGEGMPFPRQLLKNKEEDYFIVLVEGTSMTEAGINTGDYIVVHKAEEPKNGKIMLVKYENSSTIKRIKIKETKKEGRQVFLYWEDGSGDFKMVDSSEYEIQGEFYRNLGK